MDKSFWSFLQNNNFDILLLDIIDERFNLIERDSGVLHTFSLEYNTAFTESENNRFINSMSAEKFLLWKEGFDKLIMILKERSLLHKLKINVVYWIDTLSDGSTMTRYSKEYIDQNNAYLKNCYTYMKLHLSDINFIHYTKELMHCSVNHKWGVSPFHYNDDFYRETICRLNE